jgi:hypothetical protein
LDCPPSISKEKPTPAASKASRIASS